MTPISICAQQIAQFCIPQDCVVELRSGFASIFNDGRKGLNSNSDAGPNSKNALRQCIRCVRSNIPQFKIISGDAWAAKRIPRTRSADWIVLCAGQNGVQALQVEGKLGLAFEYPGDKSGTSVTLNATVQKFTDTMGVASALCFMNMMLILVPRFGKEVMWRRVRMWNKQQSGVRFASCCPDEFLALGFNDTNPYCDQQDEMVIARRQIIERELEDNLL